jgi:hypothetical protein
LNSNSVNNPRADFKCKNNFFLDDVDALDESTLSRLGRMLVSLAREATCLYTTIAPVQYMKNFLF